MSDRAPTIVHDPALEGPFAPGMTTEIDADACAVPLREWGVSNAAIAKTTIFIDGQTHYYPRHEAVSGGVMRNPKCTEGYYGSGRSTLYIHMGSILLEVGRQPETERVRAMSRIILEGLSRCADYAVMGAEAIAAENAAAQRRIAQRKGAPRALGVFAGGAITAALEVLALRYHVGRPVDILVGAVGAGATIFGGAIAYSRTREDVDNAFAIREASQGWPIDQRSRDRAVAYLAGDPPLPVTRSGLK